MIPVINMQHIKDQVLADKELAYKLRDFVGVIRLDIPGQAFDVEVGQGSPITVRPAEGEPTVTLAAPESFWDKAFSSAMPVPGYEGLVVGATHGAVLSGPFPSVVPTWFGGFDRLYKVVREVVAGAALRKEYENPFRATDTAVGRYHYMKSNGTEARIYVETAGTGPIPLMLQATAGADSRQYRHLLADPAMQERFTMYAYDLPYHGRSLPPIGERWWEQAYRPGRDWLIDWTVAIADALGLDKPFYMGCSVGGQLALDLAAERGDRFAAFISLNGWYGNPELPPGFSNDFFRSPLVSDNYGPALNFSTTAPPAPEATAHETYWVYRSGFPGVYAGDNDYFCYEHDLAVNGHKIDAHRTPVYVVTGEFDPASDDEKVGGPAVAKNVPGAIFVKLPGLGHFAPCDDPIGFSEAIVPVLDEVIAKATVGAGVSDDAR